RKNHDCKSHPQARKSRSHLGCNASRQTYRAPPRHRPLDAWRAIRHRLERHPERALPRKTRQVAENYYGAARPTRSTVKTAPLLFPASPQGKPRRLEASLRGSPAGSRRLSGEEKLFFPSLLTRG